MINKNILFERFQSYGQQPGKNELETVLTIPGDIGEGYRREISLGPGLKFYVEHYTVNEKMCARVVPEYFTLGLSICMSGHLNWTPAGPGQLPTYRTWSGQFDLSLSRSKIDNGYIECLPHEPVLLVSLLIEPDMLPYESVREGLMKALPFSMAESSDIFSHTKQPLSPRMGVAVRQLMACNFNGTAKTIYLTSKAFELIALAMDHFSTAPIPLSLTESRKRPPCSREREQLCRVRSILDRQYPNPPSLDRLARQTGLNQTKLKKGFKHLFHTTISSYLLNRRMEKGRELLQKGDTNVSEVAFKVGYANRAHFTRAFTRQFGYPPVTLLK